MVCRYSLSSSTSLTGRLGNYVYKKVAGFNGVVEDAVELDFDQTFFLASCTKLIGAIAALQCVERGLIGLDDPLDQHLPELNSQPIVKQKGDAAFVFEKPTKPLTLRHLITHSSGAAYDVMDPTLIAWRRSRGENPKFSTSGFVAKNYAYPRTFEAGEGWMYGAGLDWASLLVVRLTNQGSIRGFEDYVEENIAKLLGITSFTWHLSRKPHVSEKLMRASKRRDDGSLTDGPNPMFREPADESAGAGLYSNVHDYTRVLADLLKDSPVLLRKETIEQMFTPQFADGSNALKALEAKGERTWGPIMGRSTEGVVGNMGLGGFLVMEDCKRENYFKPKGTLTWSGMPNLLWSVNRERGLALMFATQVVPWNDEKSQALGAAFETAVWTNLSK